ncbi:MAG: hypothetical protein LBI02_03900 [Opitutaceae bacterium]|nr:hypothetical protein [Opitutaceae bacterium]
MNPTGRFDEIQKMLDAESPRPADLPIVYLFGDTGAGKTTIIRKLLGTEESKFPTTRQTRTTVAPTEYVICKREGFDITVVLKPAGEVRGYVEEILSAAIIKFQENQNTEELLRNLRQTSDQKFRLYYLLTPEFQKQIVAHIVEFSGFIRKRVRELRDEFPDAEEETGVFVELALDNSEPYRALQDDVMAGIQQQIARVCEGMQLTENFQTYKYKNIAREQFVSKCKEILSSESNSISPVIQYARIHGNLAARWLDGGMEVVIIDGEGIGHNAREVGGDQLDARHYDYFYQSDAILLIEESKKPFNAGGKSALKNAFKRGSGGKLFVLFTKLDEVAPYDAEALTEQARIHEVKDGFENTLAALKQEGIEIKLPDERIFYFGWLQTMGTEEPAIKGMKRLLSCVRKMSRRRQRFVEPRYDYEMLSAFLVKSTEQFNQIYNARLDCEHWSTVKAFNRRMVGGSEEGFKMFMPVSDLENEINEEIGPFLSKPVSWSQEVSDTLKKESVAHVLTEFTKLVLGFARRAIVAKPNQDWWESFKCRGVNSTFVRRKNIKEIFTQAVPPAAAAIGIVEFKDQIKHLIQEAVENCKKTLC